jgi:hypothetical protein
MTGGTITTNAPIIGAGPARGRASSLPWFLLGFRAAIRRDGVGSAFRCAPFHVVFCSKVVAS